MDPISTSSNGRLGAIGGRRARVVGRGFWIGVGLVALLAVAWDAGGAPAGSGAGSSSEARDEVPAKTGSEAAGRPGAAVPAVGTERRLHFDVFLDERPIGYQRFELTPTADGLTMKTQARFELTLLRIKVLDYDHHNREHWRGGCLQSIESRTRQNGKDYRVTGRSGADGFTVEGEDGRQRLAACIGTFSYWDKRELLRRPKLLNSQTGEFLAVETKSLGQGSLRIGEREIPVDRYQIEGEDLEIILAYTRDSSEWVGLDSPLFAGRTLRYRRRVEDLDAGVPTPQTPRATSP
ncbi:hypothetical protein K2X89_11015 [Myxococcota bacterium]|nr:hypothetical protein [Myxococcota bacterium]